MMGLRRKLSLALMALFGVMGLVLVMLTWKTSVQYNLEMTQRLNGSIAMYVAEEDELIRNGQHNEAAIKRLAERAMVINPTVEVYLLDRQGNVLSHNLPDGALAADRVPLGRIKAFLEPGSERPIVNLDPRSPETEKAFSAAPVVVDGQHEGYVYAILGGQTYESLASDLGKNYVLKGAFLSLGVVLLLFYGVGVLVFHHLTRPLTTLSREVQEFQHRLTGSRPALATPGEDAQVLAAAFHDMRALIEQQIEQIRKADENRRDLISNVSHDLRTPLAAIQGYVDTLKLRHDRLGPAERQEHLQVASRHCERLASLIDDLFELSKLDASVVQPNIESFSLGELMQDVAMEFKLMARERNIALNVELESRPVEVEADIALMSRVLENLIGNALKHTPEGGTVWIKLVPDGKQYTVVIEDTGRGISREELPHIFDRLYRAENSARSGTGSSGLGLAIVKKILDVHEIPIKVISRLNRGTRFSFQVPLATP
jgi:signal transduction histidine kinase